MIRIVVAGANGKMGQEVIKMVESVPNFQLVGCIERDGEYYTDTEKCLQELKPDVLIDFTAPEVGKINTKIALLNGVRPVVGTTGFTETDIQQLRTLAEEKQIGAVIAPNFAIGAILMMKFSQMAAKYLPNVDIIELHHDQKLDAPSGTAVKTAEMISEVRETKQQGHPNEKEIIVGARGANYDGIHIHSVRLPGFVAHQEVIFGGEGQILTIKHDSIHRASFMSGVKLAVETVMKLDTLVYGLDHLID